MEQVIIEQIFEKYRVKNQNYLRTQQLEDAFQDTFLYYLQRNKRAELTEINDSFISRGVLNAKRNEVNNHNNRPLHFEDIAGTNDEINVMDLIGELDMKMESVDINIDIESKIEEMAKKDVKVINVIKYHLEGWNGDEISKMTNICKSVISRIINMNTMQKRKEKREKIDKSNIEKFRKIAKRYGDEKKTYIRVADIVLMNDGRILSKQNHFNGEKTNWEFVAYIDETTIEEFTKVCKEVGFDG